MWIASSTSPPGGAGPSATSTGSIPRASATAGVSRSAIRSSNRSMATALMRRLRLVEVGPQPALSGFDLDAAPLCVILELVASDPGDAEILAVAVSEIEA